MDISKIIGPVREITPPFLLRLAGRFLKNNNLRLLVETDARLEYIDYYGNTSLFALEVLRTYGPLNQMRLLSLGSRMANLADYLSLFSVVYHSTVVETFFPIQANKFPAKLVLLQGDFFELPTLEVDCVISPATIHCFSDISYGNIRSRDRWQRAYKAAVKLRQIVGEKPVPVIVNIAVNKNEYFSNRHIHLAHEKFIDSFAKAGFALQEYFFDYLSGGLPRRPEYFDVQYRRAKRLPPPSSSPSDCVVGNYYFL
jgi:hypothetical protein